MANIINDRGIERKLTWIRDLPDARDFKFSVTAPIALPPKVDLRSRYKLIFDQGELGSCTANAIAMDIDFIRVKEKLPPVTPSRLFIYYNERVLENTVQVDAGAMIRDGIKSVATTGYCKESRWPYLIRKFSKKPSDLAYADASKSKIQSYLRLNNRNLRDLKTSLAQGYGFTFGFTVYDSFQSDEVAYTGKMPMPDLNSEVALGGHAVYAVGYDDDMQCFIVRNSWGRSWGDKGHFYMPYTFITDQDFAADFWSIRLC